MKFKSCEVFFDASKCDFDVREILRSRFGLDVYAMILHNKSEVVPHYHIYLQFTYPTDLLDVAQVFKIPTGQVYEFSSDLSSVLKYLLHWNSSDSGSSDIYSRDDLFTNINLDVYLK